MTVHLLDRRACCSPSQSGLRKNVNAGASMILTRPYTTAPLQSSSARCFAPRIDRPRTSSVARSSRHDNQDDNSHSNAISSFLHYDGDSSTAEAQLWWASRALPVPATAWFAFMLVTIFSDVFKVPGPLPPLDHLAVCIAGCAGLGVVWGALQSLLDPYDEERSEQYWLTSGAVGAVLGSIILVPDVSGPLIFNDGLTLVFMGGVTLGLYVFLSLALEQLFNNAAGWISDFNTAREANSYKDAARYKKDSEDDHMGLELVEFDKLLAKLSTTTQHKSSPAATAKLQQQNAALQNQVAALQRDLATAKAALRDSNARDRTAVKGLKKQLVAVRGEVDAAIQKANSLQHCGIDWR